MFKPEFEKFKKKPKQFGLDKPGKKTNKPKRKKDKYND
jgi:hypothetical protein